MIRAIRDNWALFAGMMMLMMANGLLSTLLSIRGSAIGFSETVIGIMQAGYPVGALAGCVIAPRLVERVGHVRAFGALASLCSVAAVMHLVTDDAVSWTAMRMLAGFCFPGLYVISEGWLNAKVDNSQRAAVLSIYFVVQTGGAAAGQALVGFGGSTVLFAITSVLISLSLIPLLLSVKPAPDYVVPERLPFARLLGVSPTAVLGAALNGVSQAGFYVALPLYGLALGKSVAEATALLVVGTISGAAVQFPVGWLSDRIDRRLVILGLSVLATLAAFAGAVGVFAGAEVVLVAFLAATVLPIYGLCVAHCNDQLRPSQIVPASGTLVLVLNAGILIGAFGGAFVLGVAGPAGFMSGLAVIAALTAAVALIRRVQTDAPEDTGHAQAISAQGTQMAAMLHPDAGEVAGDGS